MSRFFDETMQGLLEAISMEKGEIPLEKKEDMPAPTFVVFKREEELIEEFIRLRKSLDISQKELADSIGSKQQAISRVEKKEHCPSLKLFCSMINALGYELKIVKKN